MSRRLTDRQNDILALVSRGWLPEQIASEMGVQEKTIIDHLRVIRRTLRASSDAHAVAICYESGSLGGSWRDLPPPPTTT